MKSKKELTVILKQYKHYRRHDMSNTIEGVVGRPLSVYVEALIDDYIHERMVINPIYENIRLWSYGEITIS